MSHLPQNLGPRERVIRTVLGVSLVLIAIYLPLSQGWTVILFVLAAVQIITAVASYCPLYALLGRSTSKLEDKK